jgi:hypothetical protein
LEELETTLLFLAWEEDNWFYRWERMLGLVWTDEDLQYMVDQQVNGDAPAVDTSDGPRKYRYPLSLLVRPELLKSLQEKALPSSGGLFGMSHVPDDARSLSDATKNEFLRKMGASPAMFDDEISRMDRDYFDPSIRSKKGGFLPGPPRSFSGKKK